MYIVQIKQTRISQYIDLNRGNDNERIRRLYSNILLLPVGYISKTHDDENPEVISRPRT